MKSPSRVALFLFVDDSSEYEEPRIDFDRQAGAHEPSKPRIGDRSTEIHDSNKMVFDDGYRRLDAGGNGGDPREIGDKVQDGGDPVEVEVVSSPRLFRSDALEEENPVPVGESGDDDEGEGEKIKQVVLDSIFPDDSIFRWDRRGIVRAAFDGSDGALLGQERDWSSTRNRVVGRSRRRCYSLPGSHICLRRSRKKQSDNLRRI